MPLLTAPASPSHAPVQRHRCWTVCEARSHNQKANISAKTGAAAIVGRCRTNSLRISIGHGDHDHDDQDFRKSTQLVLSPCSSPSFSFDSIRDMFAAMDSPRVNMRVRSPLSNAQHLPLDDGYSAANTRVQVLSPTTKRPRTNKSETSTSRASSRTSRRYTSILSRCLPKQMKSSSSSNRDPPYHELTSESPRDHHHHHSYRATDCTTTTTTNSSIAGTTSCSALTSSSPARKRFGTVLLNDDHRDLQHLFRDEAEYSDYLSAIVTGTHSQMDSVVFYEVEVHLSQMQWMLYRRFSEFRALRQDLIKHFSKRLRQQQSNSSSGNSGCGGGSSSSSKCEICAHMLDAIEQLAFPSRHQTHRHWHKLFKSSSSSSSSGSSSPDSDSTGVKTPATAFSTEAVIADRKAKFGEFVAICLRTMRGLRQHGKVMEDSSACEIDTALRLIEEFFGLSFTRYLRFLSERGVVGGGNTNNNKQQSSMSGPTNRRRLTTVA